MNIPYKSCDILGICDSGCFWESQSKESILEIKGVFCERKKPRYRFTIKPEYTTGIDTFGWLIENIERKRHIKMSKSCKPTVYIILDI